MKTADERFQERERRVNEATALKEPDRVPVMCLSGFFPAYYVGVTCREVMYDADKAIYAFSKFAEDFQPDMVDNPFTSRFLGAVLDALEYKQLAWAGHGLNENASYQFLEREYMKADEYDQFLYDPTDFIIRTYWPRVFGTLKPMENLPPLHDIMCYYFGITKFAAFGSPEVIQMLEKLTEIAKHSQKMIAGAVRWAEASRNLGFPSQAGALTQAPFDTLSDFMRGTTGAMLDLFRQPDKVLEMTEKLLPMMIKIGLAAKQRGTPRVFIPLHKGLDGFMSMEQFKTFYWPTLKRLIEALIAEECTPIVFWEGDVTTRLELIGDIPKGKAIYSFEQTDMATAKAALGSQVCIKGNVPLSLLATGSVSEVKAYCQNLIEVAGKNGGFILDSSTVIDDAKPENVKAMFDATREFGRYG